jgi:hypothetical protein
MGVHHVDLFVPADLQQLAKRSNVEFSLLIDGVERLNT